MQKLHTPIPLLAAIFLFTVSCETPERDARPLIVTSIPPLGDWIAAVGGEAVDVQALVPANANPHTFDLTPRQLREASGAALVVLNGAGLEFWADRLLANLQQSDTPVLTLSEGVALLQTGDHHHHHHEHGGHDETAHAHGGMGNPHFWLDPLVADASVARIAEALVRILPGEKDSILARANAYREELRRLDADIAQASRAWRNRLFIGDHSAWTYFARRYGLEEAGVIEEVPGREISAREMAGLIALMRERGIVAVFADARKSPRAAEILEEETGARVAMLDPLGDGSYIETMRANLAAIDRVLR